MKLYLNGSFRALALLSILPLAAQAHPGHETTQFMSGVAHPLTGWDHLLAMLAIGMWSGQSGGRNLWALPLSFVVLMCGGVFAGILGGASYITEVGIALSVMVLGAGIALSINPSLAGGVALAGGFALFHGYAHGAEMPMQGIAWTYLAGLVLTTAGLHAGGIALARALRRRQPALRWIGAAMTLCGAWLLLG